MDMLGQVARVVQNAIFGMQAAVTHVSQTPSHAAAVASPARNAENMARLAVSAMGLEVIGTQRLGEEGTYGVVYGVQTTDNRPLAVKVFKHNADQHMIQSSADMYKVASVSGIGPVFYGAFTDGTFYAIVMERLRETVEEVLAHMTKVTPENTILLQTMGQQIDDILLRLAAVGWTCQDLKPPNLVINVHPEVVVKMIDFDLEFCQQIAKMDAPDVTKEYLKMKAAMEMVTTAFLFNWHNDVNPYIKAGGPGLFGADYRHSPEFQLGKTLLHQDAEFGRMVVWYTKQKFSPPKAPYQKSLKAATTRLDVHMDKLLQGKKQNSSLATKAKAPARKGKRRYTTTTRLVKGHSTLPGKYRDLHIPVQQVTYQMTSK